MITIYKRPGCVYCPQVMKYYDHIKVPYVVAEAEGKEYEYLSTLYGVSVPLVYNSENNIGFCGYNIMKLREVAGV